MKGIYKLLIPGIILILNCNPTPEEKFKSWSEPKDLSIEMQMIELANLGFGSTFRNAEWNENKNELYIEYGGSTALTFSDSKNYVSNILLDLSKKTFRTYSYGRTKGLKSLRISLVKPFYVKNSPDPESEIQEFEIFRIQLTEEDWDAAVGSSQVDAFQVNRDDYPEGEFLEALEKLRSQWKVELNEFSRIEVK